MNNQDYIDVTPNKKKSSSQKSFASVGWGVLYAVLLIVFIAVSFQWICCRVYVPAGKMAIVTAKSGTIPEEGTILVQKGEKGIWKDVLPEGRYFFDPIRYDVSIEDAIMIPLGKVGIVTSKVGKELKPGEIIAPDHESKGVWKDVLGPGVYRLNPEGYTVDITDAITIPAGYVGVVTSQTGTLPKPGEFAKAGQKGVLKDILQPGLYYVNRYAYQVNVIEIGMNQVTMTSADKGISLFNTKSRLNVSNTAMTELESNTLQFQQELRKSQNANFQPDVVSKMKFSVPAKPKSPRVKARLDNDGMDSVMAEAADFIPNNLGAPRAQARMMGKSKPAAKAKETALSDEAQIFGVSKEVEFPSRDGFNVSLEMTVEFELLPEAIATIYLLYGDLPQVVEKVILPQVLSVSRIKGSSYRAQEFIMGEGREIFQKDLQSELGKALKAKNIIVHNAIIRSVGIPMDILQPIRAVSLAKEQNLTNVALQETAKKLGELNKETELIEQRRREVRQETEKLVAEIAAESRREVARIQAQAQQKIAEIGVKRAEVLAKAVAVKGEAEIKAKFLISNETALGEGLWANALGGGGILAYLKAVEALSPEVKTQVIYAGEGTLWTDLKNAAIQLPAQKETAVQQKNGVKTK